MFLGATSFNQNLSRWDVSSVTDMSSMFDGALSFNQNLSKWNVSSVTDMSDMFSNVISFNGNICDWDIDNVKEGKQQILDIQNECLDRRRRRIEKRMVDKVWTKNFSGNDDIIGDVKKFLFK